MVCDVSQNGAGTCICDVTFVPRADGSCGEYPACGHECSNMSAVSGGWGWGGGGIERECACVHACTSTCVCVGVGGWGVRACVCACARAFNLCPIYVSW